MKNVNIPGNCVNVATIGVSFHVRLSSASLQFAWNAPERLYLVSGCMLHVSKYWTYMWCRITVQRASNKPVHDTILSTNIFFRRTRLINPSTSPVITPLSMLSKGCVSISPAIFVNENEIKNEIFRKTKISHHTVEAEHGKTRPDVRQRHGYMKPWSLL